MNVVQRKESDDENSRTQLQQLEGLLCLLMYRSSSHVLLVSRY